MALLPTNNVGEKIVGSLCNFGEPVQLRKLGMPKAEPSFTLGMWLGRCTESNVRFVADALSVFKTRSVGRLVPSSQMSQSLLLSVQATPWDRTGSKRVETDHFILPADPALPSQVAASTTVAESTLTQDKTTSTKDQPAQETLETTEESTSRPSGVRGQLDTTEDDLPLPHRQRLNEEVELESKRTLELEDVSSSKVQRISAIVTPDFADVKVPLYDARISAATVSKSQLEVPVVVNEDENELLLMKTFENLQRWCDTELPRQLEIDAMEREMKSMADFQVFEEVQTSSLTDAQLDTAMSTRWVKVRKRDGTVV
jgi:hypothetical protein